MCRATGNIEYLMSHFLFDIKCQLCVDPFVIFLATQKPELGMLSMPGSQHRGGQGRRIRSSALLAAKA